jgi:hypothetical protein
MRKTRHLETIRFLTLLTAALLITAHQLGSSRAAAAESDILETRLARRSSPRLFRDLVWEYLITGTDADDDLEHRHRTLTNLLLEQYATPDELRGDHLERATALAEAIRILQLTHGDPPLADQTRRWLLDPVRGPALARLLTPADHLSGAREVADAIVRHDPEGSVEFDRLAMAMAVVWDHRERAAPHPQMGPTPPRLPETLELWTYFRDLYRSGQTLVPYRELDARTLCLVVDTPLPIAELEWGAANAGSSRSRWDRQFNAIAYNQPRLDAGEFAWPHGPYALPQILEHGGICVDQAYYAVMTARARGLPALLFTGEGRRGGHAWFAYLRGPDNWELDAGRDPRGGYVTGLTRDPQTQETLTDHQLRERTEALAGQRRTEEHVQLTLLAELLLKHDRHNAALAVAEQASQLFPLSERAWSVQEQVWRTRDSATDLQAFFARKARGLAESPERALEAALRADALPGIDGGTTVAESVLDTRTSRNRDDLARAAAVQEALQQYAGGELGSGRRTLERLLRQQQREGLKLLPVLDVYLDLAERHNQTDSAARFLKRYVPVLERFSLGVPGSRAQLQRRLLRALENAGQDREAQRLREELGLPDRQP